MKRTLIITVCALLSLSANANNKVIYGDDDRLDLFETTNSLHFRLAKSTAAMIGNNKLNARGSEVTISGQSLEQRGICAGEKFAEQITSARCSGFLVGDDILVTAGHCVQSASDCKNNKWVFDFAVDHANKQTFSVDKDDVYSCKKIIKTSLDRSTKDDYAIVKLDRPVRGRTPLKVRTSGKVATGTQLVVIGHPTGLPTKVAAGAKVRGNSNSVYFVSNLDTFGGNSGSAVMDAHTGLVEGILVRGETDYEYDWSRGCRVPKKCSNSGCRGEDVTRITNLKELASLL